MEELEEEKQGLDQHGTKKMNIVCVCVYTCTCGCVYVYEQQCVGDYLGFLSALRIIFVFVFRAVMAEQQWQASLRCHQGEHERRRG